MNHSVSISKQETSRRQGLLTIISKCQTSRDWTDVQEKAAMFLRGQIVIASRIDTVRENGEYVGKLMPVRIDMGDVVIAVFETAGFAALLADLTNGKPNAAEAISDLTRKKAYEVAFYALDLDERWTDLQHLIGEATK